MSQIGVRHWPSGLPTDVGKLSVPDAAGKGLMPRAWASDGGSPTFLPVAGMKGNEVASREQVFI